MSEGASGAGVVAPGASPASAGAMLRSARQDAGVHIGVLSASLKVPQAKLEALEADRYDALPDPAFTRALAQSICRVLKIDPAPVLARLPSAGPTGLERVDRGLNTPLRQRSGRGDLFDNPAWRLPAFWLVVLCLAGAAAVLFTPAAWVRNIAGAFGVERPAAATAGDATSISAALPASALAGGIVERVNAVVVAASEALVPEPARSPSSARASDGEAALPAATAGPGTRIRALEATWVQVTDGRGQILLSRLLPAGEVVGLDEPPPLRLRIGNAHGTEVTQQGQVVDLSPVTRDNVATLELR